MVDVYYNRYDPEVVALTKAIRQKETGNRVIRGLSGELPSRYQWMPKTWSEEAGKYLKNSKAPLTLGNENYVAYMRIKQWKDEGFNPGQIASLWNSGNPNPNEAGHGVNKKGIAFNTPAYVNSVYKLYQQYKSVPQGGEI